MGQRSFTAQVSQWAAKSENRVRAVFRESAQRVVSDMQTPRGEGGRMRVDTGFLRASLQASLSGMPQTDANSKPTKGATYSWQETDVSLVILGADLGDTIYVGYTAAYAAAREYGARGQAPDAFVRTAAAKWPQHVQAVIQEARARYP